MAHTQSGSVMQFLCTTGFGGHEKLCETFPKVHKQEISVDSELIGVIRWSLRLRLLPTTVSTEMSLIEEKILYVD